MQYVDDTYHYSVSLVEIDSSGNESTEQYQNCSFSLHLEHRDKSYNQVGYHPHVHIRPKKKCQRFKKYFLKNSINNKHPSYRILDIDFASTFLLVFTGIYVNVRIKTIVFVVGFCI